MLAKGRAYWCALHQAKEDNFGKVKYNVILHLTDEKSKKILRDNGCEVKNTSSSPDWEPGFKGDYVEFTKPYKTRKGDINKPIPVVDVHKNPITENVGNGSEVIVSWKPYEWEFAGKKGIKPILVAVQVHKLIPYDEAGVSEFENYSEETADF